MQSGRTKRVIPTELTHVVLDVRDILVLFGNAMAIHSVVRRQIAFCFSVGGLRPFYRRGHRSMPHYTVRLEFFKSTGSTLRLSLCRSSLLVTLSCLSSWWQLMRMPAIFVRFALQIVRSPAMKFLAIRGIQRTVWRHLSPQFMHYYSFFSVSDPFHIQFLHRDPQIW